MRAGHPNKIKIEPSFTQCLRAILTCSKMPIMETEYGNRVWKPSMETEYGNRVWKPSMETEYGNRVCPEEDFQQTWSDLDLSPQVGTWHWLNTKLAFDTLQLISFMFITISITTVNKWLRLTEPPPQGPSVQSCSWCSTRVELALDIVSFYYTNPAQPATSLLWYGLVYTTLHTTADYLVAIRWHRAEMVRWAVQNGETHRWWEEPSVLRVKLFWHFVVPKKNTVVIAHWNEWISLFVPAAAQVLFPATAEYFKGFFPGWSRSVDPSWASVAENGSTSHQWHHTTCPEPAWQNMAQSPLNDTTQPVNIEERGWSPATNRHGWDEKEEKKINTHKN